MQNSLKFAIFLGGMHQAPSLSSLTGSLCQGRRGQLQMMMMRRRKEALNLSPRSTSFSLGTGKVDIDISLRRSESSTKFKCLKITLLNVAFGVNKINWYKIN